MNTVTVQTSRPYDVLIGSGLLSRCGSLIADVTKARTCVVVSDSTVAPLYAYTVCCSLKDAGFTPHLITIPAGEQNKTLMLCGDILSFFARNGLTRSDLVVALGGGVTGDIAGFSAAIYQRGVEFIQIPTTLLAACDASVGGKTGVDLPEGKNLAGAFHQPLLVICDTDSFKTLPAPILSEGMAEVIKHALIADAQLLTTLMEQDPLSRIVDIVHRNVAIKSSIVSADEQEHGRRKILNFGHTLGHAIEKCSSYTIPHGNAVAIGMVLAARAGEKLGHSPKGTLEAVVSAVTHFGLPSTCVYRADELYAAAVSDKKRSGDRIDIVILKEIGRAETVPLSMEELRDFTEAAVCV